MKKYKDFIIILNVINDLKLNVVSLFRLASDSLFFALVKISYRLFC